MVKYLKRDQGALGTFMVVRQISLFILCTFAVIAFAQTKPANLGTTYSKFMSDLATLGVAVSLKESPVDTSEMRWMGTVGNVIIEVYGNRVTYQLRKIYVGAFFSNTDNVANMNSLAALLSPIVGSLPMEARGTVTKWVTDQVAAAVTTTESRIVRKHYTRGLTFNLIYERNLGFWSLSVERA